MNNCIFVGKLAADPELKVTSNSQVVNFTLAVEEYRKDKDGTKHRRVDYLDFEAWDSGAATIAKYFKKGDMLIIESEARQHKWVSSDETKKQKIVFRVKTFKSAMKNHSQDFDNTDKELR